MATKRDISALKKQKAANTLRRLNELAEQVVAQAEKGQNPTIEIPIRALSNVSWNEKSAIIEMGDRTQSRTLFNVNMAKRFTQTFLVAAACKELLDSGKTTSIRDLYYMTKHTIGKTSENTFDGQEESDPIIEDLEVTINALREELHLFASNRGSMVGEVTFVDAGDTIDARRQGSGGWAVPSIVEDDVIQFVKNDAKFILLVEKDAVWRRLNEDKFWRKHKCILVQSGGQPARGVRRLLRRMVDELKIPLYVLVDNDPWGLYIYSVLKQGSINLAYESVRMAVPTARFLGLSSFDRERYELPDGSTIMLNKKDEDRAKQMMRYPWFADRKWQRELKKMLDSKVKLEIEALSRKGITFISEEYLPRKLAERDWLV
ncbi:MAG: DNA topoisomerase IV subunit A [Polyangia bacterium]|jgi:DNA topoisomerase-6 subunit A|nr:DNA topoisomerase IV subunit A [Polyangia bacterium]